MGDKKPSSSTAADGTAADGAAGSKTEKVGSDTLVSSRHRILLHRRVRESRHSSSSMRILRSACFAERLVRLIAARVLLTRFFL